MKNSVIEDDLKFISSTDLPWETFANKTVLVTGANGFLPSYMVETLIYLSEKKGISVNIIGLVRNIEKAKKRFAKYLHLPYFRLKVQDVCAPLDHEGRVEYIIHAASLATPKFFSNYPIETILPNTTGTANMLEFAAHSRCEGFLFFSTTGVYGFNEPKKYPLKEDCFGELDPMSLASVYVESKRMGENMCVAWMKQKGVPVKIVRPAITYGPGILLDDGRSFADFIAAILNRKDIELYSDGRAIRNFCYIADAIVGFFTVMLKGQVGEAYNVATDHEISIIDLANLLVQKVFPERNLKVVMKSDNKKEFLRMNFPRTTVDITKARKLGWKLSFSIEEGFRRTVKSFEETSVPNYEVTL
ncbi:MAG: NAD-dependent epimerase/dehydratase family protein [Bacteriovoracia bacterium]